MYFHRNIISQFEVFLYRKPTFFIRHVFFTKRLLESDDIRYLLLRRLKKPSANNVKLYKRILMVTTNFLIAIAIFPRARERERDRDGIIISITIRLASAHCSGTPVSFNLNSTANWNVWYPIIQTTEIIYMWASAA